MVRTGDLFFSVTMRRMDGTRQCYVHFMTVNKTPSVGASDQPLPHPASPMPQKATPEVAGPRLAESVPIVAIGASSGGLKAASGLLDAISPTTGMAFIVVQHLDPTHKSMMVDLLADHTTMDIGEAIDGCVIRRDHIYVIPPGRYLSVEDGALALSPQQAHHGARLPFDCLLASLAEECGDRTIAVILSGTGADGSGGLAALKAAGGYAIAQKPEQADYDGMPRSAIETGLVDQTLALEDIPQALADRKVAIAQSAAAPSVPAPSSMPAPPASTDLNAIIAFLNDNTAHDFRQYKSGTLERRIERRIVLRTLAPGNLAGYLDLLRTEPAERDLLAKDLLINVTRFFRDPAIFDALAQTILPDLVRLLPEQTPLRIWVAGCSTGEEAYSIAMLCRDAIKASGRDIKLKLFASDVDPDAIATAREGLYPFDIENTVPADLLARFFVRDEAGYRVATALRDTVVFTVQDVLSDPPFSKIDLVSCRNLLIYLNPEAQAKVISLFHFALREGGILLLGSSETVGSAGDRFEVIAKSERIYRHVAHGRTGTAGFPVSFGDALPMPGTTGRSASSQRQATLADICRRAVIATHAPAAILINRKRQCLYSIGPTDRYLRIPPGYATLDLLAMASPTLRTKLRLAIDKVSEATPRVDGGRTRVMQDGIAIWFRIDVMAVVDGQDDMLLVCFVEEPGESAGATASPNRGDAARVTELEQELEATQAELQTSILNQETSSQEQKTINEEALSVNEEFQSTNEELLTSKEELQSLNEELTALNSQLQETLERQRLTSDDLQNVLYSTNVATLFLDIDLKIRFYTPAIKSVFNIIAGDIGRPITDLRSIATDPDLLGDARKVLADHGLIDREISAPNDTWFLRRVFPYRTHDDAVEGVVITFADTTDRKMTAKALEAAKIEADRANLAKSRFLAAASHDLRQPLQSLTLLQELLSQTVEGEKPRKLVSRQGQTLAAMSGMLNALLDINQIEAGVVEAMPVVFPISDVLDLLRDEFGYLAQARNLSLHILPSAALVHSDATLLTQMLRNLLGNAIKYTKQGKILLGCRRRGDTLRIEVWDTGIGIAADQLHAIFEEFHQIDNAARERSLGLGLGLSIVQRLGHLLGHAIDVRSRPNAGSVFTITLPCPAADPPGAVAKPPEPDAAPDGHRRTCKIVVVDDDPDVVELLEQLLKREGHIVKTAADAASAIKLVAGSAIKPELLLTDYNLPGGRDGLDLLRSLRATLPHGLPAIVLTGDISSAALARIAAEDCVQLSKPVKARDLLAAIERLLARALPSALHPAGAVAIAGPSITYVVDDDPYILATIRDVLEGDGRSVQDFPNAEAFLAAYASGNDGCLLVDAHLPGMSGVALIEQLRARANHLPAILITGSGDIGLAVKAMRSGACDFIEKPVGRVELLASVARAIDQSHDLRLRDDAHQKAAAHVGELTDRQREVMDLVLAGHPNKNIAADLGISQRTVENHRAAVMHKMQAKSLPELARIAQAAADGNAARPRSALPPTESAAV